MLSLSPFLSYKAFLSQPANGGASGGNDEIVFPWQASGLELQAGRFEVLRHSPRM